MKEHSFDKFGMCIHCKCLAQYAPDNCGDSELGEWKRRYDVVMLAVVAVVLTLCIGAIFGVI